MVTNASNPTFPRPEALSGTLVKPVFLSSCAPGAAPGIWAVTPPLLGPEASRRDKPSTFQSSGRAPRGIQPGIQEGNRDLRGGAVGAEDGVDADRSCLEVVYSNACVYYAYVEECGRDECSFSQGFMIDTRGLMIHSVDYQYCLVIYEVFHFSIR